MRRWPAGLALKIFERPGYWLLDDFIDFIDVESPWTRCVVKVYITPQRLQLILMLIPCSHIHQFCCTISQLILLLAAQQH
jgi:hypothetical protein